MIKYQTLKCKIAGFRVALYCADYPDWHAKRILSVFKLPSNRNILIWAKNSLR